MNTYGYIPNIDVEDIQQLAELEKLKSYKLVYIDLRADEVEKIILEYLKDNLDLNLRLLDCKMNFTVVKHLNSVSSYWELLDITIYPNGESLEEMNYVKDTINSYFGRNTMYEISDCEYQISSKKILRRIFENACPQPTNTGYALTISYEHIDDFVNSPVCRYIL